MTSESSEATGMPAAAGSADRAGAATGGARTPDPDQTGVPGADPGTAAVGEMQVSGTDMSTPARESGETAETSEEQRPV